MRNGLKKQIISGLFWKFGERILAQGVSFIVSLVLARMLLPEEYGSVALVLVFINLANVFVSNGLGETLIQKPNAKQSAVKIKKIFSPRQANNAEPKIVPAKLPHVPGAGRINPEPKPNASK